MDGRFKGDGNYGSVTQISLVRQVPVRMLFGGGLGPAPGGGGADDTVANTSSVYLALFPSFNHRFALFTARSLVTLIARFRRPTGRARTPSIPAIAIPPGDEY